MSVWLPSVVRKDGELRLRVVGGADALHDPRTFTLPITEVHAEALSDLGRRVLLLGKLLPLCYAAGTSGPLDESAAVGLLDPILLGTPEQIDALCAHDRSVADQLIARGADVGMVERGELYAASRAVTEDPDWQRVEKHRADRRRAERGVDLGRLDSAILQYTGQLVHGATMPKRLPDAVDAAPLSDVLDVIAIAERASADSVIGRDPRTGRRSTDKAAWRRVEQEVRDAVGRAYPTLAEDTLRSVAFLMCSEVADRSGPVVADGGAPVHGMSVPPRVLTFSDDKESEETWRPGDPRPADDAFWDFVADRASSENSVFTLESEEQGEGIQLHFYADSLARVTTVTDGDESRYQVEYTLVDGLDAYYALVSTYVHGGCAALDPLGPWIGDVEEFERARRQRDEARNR